MGNCVQVDLQAKALGLVKLKIIFISLKSWRLKSAVEATPENTAFPQAQVRRADSCNIQSDPVGEWPSTTQPQVQPALLR
jgi:hypothetical protein